MVAKGLIMIVKGRLWLVMCDGCSIVEKGGPTRLEIVCFDSGDHC